MVYAKYADGRGDYLKKKNVLLMVCTYIILFLCFNVVGYAQENNYKSMSPKSNVATDKSWYVKFTREIDKSTVNDDNIYMTDQNDNKIKCYLEVQPDNKTVKVVSLVYYKYDATYNLIVSSNVKEASGKNLSHSIKMPLPQERSLLLQTAVKIIKN